VAEERRLRTDTQAEGKLDEETKAAAFMAHPYGDPIIGWMSDIQNLTRRQALAFRKTYYVPNNAVATIVGDFKPAQIIPIIDKYFGPIPAGPPPPGVLTKEPPQTGERRVKVVFDAQPQMMMMFHKPTLPAHDDFVFDVINSLLTEGRTSRLYTALVKEKKIAAAVDGSQGEPGARYDNLYDLEAIPRYPHTVAETEAAIWEELERLKTQPVSAEELQKVKNNLEAQFIYGLQSNMGLVEQLGYYQTIAGDWRYLLRWRSTMQKITAEDVMNTAKKYFVRSNMTFGEIVSPEAPAAPGNGGSATGPAQGGGA
jgi:predicted Zn-dependent peptidase